jgi:hypothetical protein
MCNAVSLPGVWRGWVARGHVIQVEPLVVRSPCAGPGARRDSSRLEKRGQTLQACNLTRNIQADGAPRVHRTPEGSNLRGFFFATIGHRSHASENAPGSRPGVSFRHWFASWCQRGRMLVGLSGDPMSPMHLSGTLRQGRGGPCRGKSVAKPEAGSFNSRGLCTGQVHALRRNSAPDARQPPSPRLLGHGRRGHDRSDPCRLVHAAVFP